MQDNIAKRSLHYVLPYGIGGKCSEKLPHTEKKRKIFAPKKGKELLPKKNFPCNNSFF